MKEYKDMTPLERTRYTAQQTADREGRSQVILNLNKIGVPLYVIRGIDAASASSYVETVHPNGISN